MTSAKPPGEPDPVDAGPRFRPLGAAFWAMIAFGFFCALAGLVVGRFGPQLFPLKPAVHASVSPPPLVASPVRN
jgi:hypothetical protein